MDFKFAVIPAIVVMTWFVALMVKTFTSSKTVEKCIPCICGATGLVLSVIIYLTVPGFIPADNWPTVVCIGIASGFAATGIDQIYKQFTKPESINIPK